MQLWRAKCRNFSVFTYRLFKFWELSFLLSQVTWYSSYIHFKVSRPVRDQDVDPQGSSNLVRTSLIFEEKNELRLLWNLLIYINVLFQKLTSLSQRIVQNYVTLSNTGRKRRRLFSALLMKLSDSLPSFRHTSTYKEASLPFYYFMLYTINRYDFPEVNNCSREYVIATLTMTPSMKFLTFGNNQIFLQKKKRTNKELMKKFWFWTLLPLFPLTYNRYVFQTDNGN